MWHLDLVGVLHMPFKAYTFKVSVVRGQVDDVTSTKFDLRRRLYD